MGRCGGWCLSGGEGAQEVVKLDASAVLNTTAAALLAFVAYQLQQNTTAIAVIQKTDAVQDINIARLERQIEGIKE